MTYSQSLSTIILNTSSVYINHIVSCCQAIIRNVLYIKHVWLYPLLMYDFKDRVKKSQGLDIRTAATCVPFYQQRRRHGTPAVVTKNVCCFFLLLLYYFRFVSSSSSQFSFSPSYGLTARHTPHRPRWVCVRNKPNHIASADAMVCLSTTDYGTHNDLTFSSV